MLSLRTLSLSTILVYSGLVARPAFAQIGFGVGQPSPSAGRPADSAQATLAPLPSVPWDSANAGWTGRLVVGEYTTGIFCGFCQPHDAAFNALLQRYPATAFISLAYHYDPNLPFGDPADSALDHVHRWYGVDKEPGMFDHLPAKGDDDWIDGQSVNPTINIGALFSNTAGGGTANYARLAHAIDRELQRPPEAFLQVRTRATGGQIHVQVRVDSVVGDHPETYLRLLLVEDTVSLLHPLYWYRQRVKQIGGQEYPLRREHHMIVRAVAHTGQLLLGLPLHAPGTVSYTFDVAAIQRRQWDYHNAGVVALRPYGPEYRTDTANVNLMRTILETFPDVHDWRLDPKRLHIVAFVQDAHTGAVLQAVMVGVPALQLPTS